MTAKVLIEKEFEYKDPPSHVQVPPLVVQPATQHPKQGYHPEMPLAYPRASSSTVVAPQYAYIGAPYVPFGVHYGHTPIQIVNPSLVNSAQMFLPVAIPQIHSQL